MDWPFNAGRLTLFRREGGAISTHQVSAVQVGPPEAVMGVVGPIWMAPDGLFTGNVHPYSGAPFSPAILEEPQEVPIVRFSVEGTVVDTVGSYLYPLIGGARERIQVGRSEYYLHRPAEGDPLDFVLPDGLVRVERPIADPESVGTFVITRQDFDGNLRFRQTFTYNPVPYPDSVLQFRAAVASRSGVSGEVSPTGGIVRRETFSADSSRAHESMLQQMAFPPFQPPISGSPGFRPFYVGADGTLWLRREDAGGGFHRWLGLNPDGTPIGILHLPYSGMQIVWSRERTIWVVERDEVGVPFLVRYRLES
jgi:hypothetical protein